MKKQTTALEKALQDYLRAGVPVPDEFLDSEEIHTEVEIGILPGYSKSNLDDMWIQQINNRRLGFHLMPGENLARFFQLLNVHPRDVLEEHHLRMTPAEQEPYWGDDARDSVNSRNADLLQQMLKLLVDFEVDSSRPALCSNETARIIYDNASYGGYPLIAGYARVSDILELDFGAPVKIGGRFQIGIHDSANGSGHMESCVCQSFEMKLERGDLIALPTKGWTPNAVYGFVHGYYQLQIENQRTKATA